MMQLFRVHESWGDCAAKVQDDGKLVWIFFVNCSLTVPTDIRELYAVRCGRDMLQDASEIIASVHGVADVVCHKHRVAFTVPNVTHQPSDCSGTVTNKECLAAIHSALRAASETRWEPVCATRHSLVALLSQRLQQASFRAAAAAHYAEQYGASSALHVLQLSDTWR